MILIGLLNVFLKTIKRLAEWRSDHVMLTFKHKNSSWKKINIKFLAVQVSGKHFYLLEHLKDLSDVPQILLNY